MGPTILLDKSSLQALSKKELILLHKLYYVNTPPVLLLEILADLKKTKDLKLLNERTVVEIANKLIQKDNTINAHYLDLVISSLLGEDFVDSRRPCIGGAKKVIEKSGKVGFHIEETREQVALRNWQKGVFTADDKALAEQWKAYSKEINLLELKNNYLEIKKIFPECKDIKTLLDISAYLLNNPSLQSQLLFLTVDELRIEQKLVSSILSRWESGQFKLLKDFAPYYYFVNQIDTAFRLGLVYDLITIRSTNRIDCEYIYYLPFCNIFSSRDNFHKSFATIFMDKNQMFIDGDDLKADLQSIVEQLERENNKLNIDWNIQFSIEPPKNENSFTYRMWKNYLPSWTSGWFNRKSSHLYKDEKNFQDMKERINSFQEVEFDHSQKLFENEIDFISIEKHISLDDQCVCGSGKKFKDCCYKPEMKPDT